MGERGDEPVVPVRNRTRRQRWLIGGVLSCVLVAVVAPFVVSHSGDDEVAGEVPPTPPRSTEPATTPVTTVPATTVPATRTPVTTAPATSTDVVDSTSPMTVPTT